MVFLDTNLNVRAVYKLLEVFQSNNIMVYITTNLKKPVDAMGRQTMRANTRATIQAANVLLILFGSLMVGATHKELLRIEGFQPCRLLNSLKHHKRKYP